MIAIVNGVYMFHEFMKRIILLPLGTGGMWLIFYFFPDIANDRADFFTWLGFLSSLMAYGSVLIYWVEREENSSR